MKRGFHWGMAACAVLAAVAIFAAFRRPGLPPDFPAAPGGAPVALTPEKEITHGHGLAVDRADGNKLYIATHLGLLVLVDEKDLYRVGRTRDDYMGFSPHPTEPKVFFSSGHPSAGGNIGFQKSDDGGSSWRKISGGLDGPVDFHAMTVSPADPDVVYGWYRGDLQRSSDGGKTWQASPTGFVVVSLAADPRDENLIYAASAQGQGVMVSKDGGENWGSLSEDLKGGQVATVAIDPSDPRRILASSEKLGPVHSTDGGVTWQKTAGSFDGTIIHYAFDPRDSSRVYALTHTNALYRSADGGRTWTEIQLITP